MTADQPLVTHADRADLDALRSMVEDFDSNAADRQVDLLDRLIAAAEADKPALPEGWVLLQYKDGSQRVLHHKDGRLNVLNDGSGYMGPVEQQRDRPTPLVTAASLVPEGWHVDEDGEGRPTIWDADDLPVERQQSTMLDPAFDVLAALVSAAQAERGESR